MRVFLLFMVFGVCAAKLGSTPLVEGAEAIRVLVIGNRIPDQSFFWYDPMLEYRILPFPSWAEPGVTSVENARRWLRSQRKDKLLVDHDFFIELPYAVAGLSQYFPTSEILRCIRERNASVLLPVPQTELLAVLSPDDTRTEPGETELARQNREVLRARLRQDFSISLGPDPCLSGFKGLVEEYRDANLFVMDDVHPSADILAKVQVTAWVGGWIEEPWLVRLELSALPPIPGLESGKGYVWKCASPLTGVFFFPRGGFVATGFLSADRPYGVASLKIGEEHEFAWDMVSHIVLSSRWLQIPDLETAHQARKRFGEYGFLYLDAFRSLDEAELFSSEADTYEVWVDLAETLKGYREAAAHYREEDVEGSYAIMEEHLLRIRAADLRALRILKQSLFWVHYTEYVVVTVTFVLALWLTLHFIYRPRVRIVGTTRYAPIERGIAARRIPRRGKAGWTRTRILAGAVLVIFSLVLLSSPVYLGLGFSEGAYEFVGLLTLSESKEGPGVVSEVYGEYPVKISVVHGRGEIHVSDAVRTGMQAPLLGGEVFHVSRFRVKYNAIRCRIESHAVELKWTRESGVDYLARDGPRIAANLSVGRISGKSFGLPGFSAELMLSR